MISKRTTRHQQGQQVLPKCWPKCWPIFITSQSQFSSHSNPSIDDDLMPNLFRTKNIQFLAFFSSCTRTNAQLSTLSTRSFDKWFAPPIDLLEYSPTYHLSHINQDLWPHSSKEKSTRWIQGPRFGSILCWIIHTNSYKNTKNSSHKHKKIPLCDDFETNHSTPARSTGVA